MNTIALAEEMNTAVLADGMTKYEKISIALAIAALVISVLVPLQVTSYLSTITIKVFFNIVKKDSNYIIQLYWLIILVISV